jgi:hypothetical protein
VWLAGIGSVTAFAASVVGIAAAFGWLPQPSPSSLEKPEPATTVPVLIESSGGARVRGFFAGNGYVVTYGVSFLDSGAMAVWTVDGKTVRASVQVVKRGGAQSQAALLRVVGTQPPSVKAATRPAEDLKKGEPVRYPLGPERFGTGEVVDPSAQVHDFPLLDGNQQPLKVLVTTGAGLGEGDAGAPVTDAEGRILGMMIARAGAQWYSVPVTVLVAEFPQAFPSTG